VDRNLRGIGQVMFQDNPISALLTAGPEARLSPA